jgi:ubiquinone/menaquinone biosynthesis C-methylase UbiE
MTSGLLQTTRERLEGSPFKGRVSYHEGDIQKLPFEDSRLDLIWFSRTVHHLPEQLAGMRELRRVLKPGGRFALREGRLRPRFLPSDMGIGEPGLEDRLEAAFQAWFQRCVRDVEGAVRYSYGWTQLLRDSGLTNMTVKTFVLEVLPPLTDFQAGFMKGLLSRWVESDECRAFISDEDAKSIEQLIEPESPRYTINRQDLHYMEGVMVYVGKG